MAVERKLTVADFDAFIAKPENADRLFELINGEIVEKMPTQRHGVISVNITTPLKLDIKRRGAGRVSVEVRHQLPNDPENARLPDISYYADATKPSVNKGAVPTMPDLAIEIKSPDDSYTALRDKANYYLANGTKVVWLVYPEKRAVEALTLDDFEFFYEDDILDGGDLLPGFTLPVREIFED